MIYSLPARLKIVTFKILNSLTLIIYIFFISRIFRCTLNRIPETNNLLQKSRLPLGILIHPFKDLNVSIYKYFLLQTELFAQYLEIFLSICYKGNHLSIIHLEWIACPTKIILYYIQ